MEICIIFFKWKFASFSFKWKFASFSSNGNLHYFLSNGNLHHFFPHLMEGHNSMNIQLLWNLSTTLRSLAGPLYNFVRYNQTSCFLQVLYIFLISWQNNSVAIMFSSLFRRYIHLLLLVQLLGCETQRTDRDARGHWVGRSTSNCHKTFTTRIQHLAWYRTVEICRPERWIVWTTYSSAEGEYLEYVLSQSSGRPIFFLQINEISFRIKSWSLRIISWYNFLSIIFVRIEIQIFLKFLRIEIFRSIRRFSELRIGFRIKISGWLM